VSEHSSLLIDDPEASRALQKILREVAETEESTAALRAKLRGASASTVGRSPLVDVADLLANAGGAGSGTTAAEVENDNFDGGVGGSGERERYLDGEQVQEQEQEQ